jgi:hypothetical protein
MQASKSESEETATDTPSRQLKGDMAVDRRQTQSLCEVNSELQMTMLGSM